MIFGSAFRGLFGMRVVRREHLSTEGPVLVASNHQSYLDPPLIGNAIEELMRVHGVAGTERGVTQDMVYEGVTFKAGDRLVFPAHIYGLDTQLVQDPLTTKRSLKITAHR